MWLKILGWIIIVVPVIPSLVTDIENLWRSTPKSGNKKWLSVEQALSGSISEVASEVAKLAPTGTKAGDVSTAIVIFTKAVNDAAVALANTLQIFPHDGQPAVNASGTPVVKP